MIRSLDIGPRERWTRGRLPIHLALATHHAPTTAVRDCDPALIAQATEEWVQTEMARAHRDFNEKAWTAGRVALHMAEVTIGHCQPAHPRSRLCFWRIMTWIAVLPSIAVLSLRAALYLLRGV